MQPNIAHTDTNPQEKFAEDQIRVPIWFFFELARTLAFHLFRGCNSQFADLHYTSLINLVR